MKIICWIILLSLITGCVSTNGVNTEFKTLGTEVIRHQVLYKEVVPQYESSSGEVGEFVSVNTTLYDITYTGTNVIVDFNNGNLQHVVLTNDAHLSQPTNGVVGFYTLLIQQDSTGSRLLSYDPTWDFGTAGEPTLTTTGDKSDVLSLIILGDTNILTAIGSQGGFIIP